MRDYEKEFTDRVAFIRQLLAESGAAGIVYGNSGGKDSALVGILCKAACENTVGLLLPCTSKRNYAEDRADAETVAAQYRIETRTVDLTPVKAAALAALDGVTTPNAPALANLAPRLRMLTLYAVAASVIGGVSTLGGQGILLGTVIGASIWGVLQNGLQFAGAPVAIRNIVIGIIVVVSVLLDVVVRSGRKPRRKKEPAAAKAA